VHEHGQALREIFIFIYIIPDGATLPQENILFEKGQELTELLPELSISDEPVEATLHSPSQSHIECHSAVVEVTGNSCYHWGISF
jgi:hypothetical protein